METEETLQSLIDDAEAAFGAFDGAAAAEVMAELTAVTQPDSRPIRGLLELQRIELERRITRLECATTAAATAAYGNLSANIAPIPSPVDEHLAALAAAVGVTDAVCV